MSRDDITRIESEIAGLTAKIVEREKNHQTDFGPHGAGGGGFAPHVGRGEPFRHTDKFVKAHRVQLRALQVQLVMLQMEAGSWDPARIIELFSALDTA